MAAAWRDEGLRAVLVPHPGDRPRAAGLLLVRWEPKLPSDVEPAPAEAPAAPMELGSVEELYLTGVHLEQYRHPTRSPLPYYEEALRLPSEHGYGNGVAVVTRDGDPGRRCVPRSAACR